VMNVRFRLLPYSYTLFHAAHTKGGTVMRALSWNFPDEEALKNVDNQFMLGPSILITPVLAPLLRAAQGVFPGVPTTRWYDWYTLEEVQAQPGQNVTLDAPLEHIPVHVRGGSIIASQVPGNTTKTTRSNPWSVLVALDANQQAEGELYLDDGVSLEPEDHKEVQFQFQSSTLTAVTSGSYTDNNPLANITVTGWSTDSGDTKCSGIEISINGQAVDGGKVSVSSEKGATHLTGLENLFKDGAFTQNLAVTLY